RGPPLRLRLHAGLARRARRAPAQAPAAAAGRRLATRRGASPPFRNLPPGPVAPAEAGARAAVNPTPSEFPIGGPRRASSPRGAIATIVSAVRPQRSDAMPPSQQPSAPMAITRNVAPLALSPA